MNKQKIVTSLWFDKEAEEAMNYYVEVFNNAPNSAKDSKINSISYYPENAEDEHLKGMDGKVINGDFSLAGQRFICLDGGPLFKFSEAISLTVETSDQEETDYFWEKLVEGGGEESQCGWLKDKYGLSWQIVPKRLGELMSDSDAEKTGRVMGALMKMQKIEISVLEEAFEGK